MTETQRDRNTEQLRAGVVGLGMIGGGVAVSLARSGFVPTVYDIRPTAADGLAGVPAPLDSPAEVAAASDVVMVAVVDADQAREVIGGRAGLLEGARPGLTVVLLATVELPVVRELALMCAEAGVGLLDCGVTPGDRAAENGMVAILGGDQDVVDQALPVLAGWAKKVVHCGPLGAGMATKIARNVVTYGGWSIVAEAVALAEAAGVDPARLTEVIDTADPGGRTLLQLLGLRIAGEGALPDAMAAKVEPLMTKDLDAARALAAELGVAVPLVDVARQRTPQTLDQQTEPADDPRTRGLELMDQVYGPGFSDNVPETDEPYLTETVEHLFGDIWSRPGLSVRDRRLLTMGVGASLGRAELIRIQARGALHNHELTPDQLREAVLHLAYYVGWCNSTAAQQGVADAIADVSPTKEVR
ncbi:NAD(P)-binding domain-containing protein [Streptomyces sp. GQFP]|uniref:NAD(P)-binding domain-containing protein n=1 Tax=Streptomyces sp. GQFP TaxID=2907545 RepID=UPI001F23088A|nr:NAD(P)-binding domain-containing protein [Streptomyces sp. GQFP]UIX29136.1 NAD(P)-binding domain-containing protein [Streptomyces sp. GQFP]